MLPLATDLKKLRNLRFESCLVLPLHRFAGMDVRTLINHNLHTGKEEWHSRVSGGTTKKNQIHDKKNKPGKALRIFLQGMEHHQQLHLIQGEDGQTWS